MIATLKKPRSLILNTISHFTLQSHSLLRKLDIASTVRATNWISRRQMRMELGLLFPADKYNVSNERSLSNCTAQTDTQIRHTHTHTHSNVRKGWVHKRGVMLKVVKPRNITRCSLLLLRLFSNPSWKKQRKQFFSYETTINARTEAHLICQAYILFGQYILQSTAVAYRGGWG